MHNAVDRDTGNKKLVAGKPYSYVENVTQPTITVYSPAKKDTGAAIIVYPGGGFNVLAIDIEGTEACHWLRSNGISCVLLKYRVPCEHVGEYRECPQAHQDAQRAMSLVRSRAAEWHINPKSHLTRAHACIHHRGTKGNGGGRRNCFEKASPSSFVALCVSVVNTRVR